MRKLSTNPAICGTVAFHDPVRGYPAGDMHGANADARSRHGDADPSARAPPRGPLHGDAVAALDFADLVDVINTESDGDELQLPLSSSTTDRETDVSFVVALFCDGFVCRHWTRKSGWVEGFAQSYDATSRYFLDCLERERLPDGLLELIDPTSPTNELVAEIWDLRTHLTALCPLTSADLPRTAPLPSEVSGAGVRQVVLKPRDQLVLTDVAKFTQHDQHPASEQFPQLSNADLEALSYDELATLALGPDVDLVQVDESLALLSVDEVAGPITKEDEDASIVNVHAGSDAIDMLLHENDYADETSIAGKRAQQLNVDNTKNDGDGEALELDDLITPKRTSIEDLPPWEQSSSLSSPRAFLSPNESKAMRSQANARKGAIRPSLGGANFTSWPSEDSTSSDDDWVVKNAMLRTIMPIDSHLAVVKTEKPPCSLSHERVRPAKQAKTKKGSRPSSPINGALDSMPCPSFHLSLSQDACNWLDAVDNKSTPKKKKKKYRCQKPSIDSVTPLPATHLFLSRLKGKRPRNYTIDELDHGSPAWMMMKHMTRFYQAALTFERRHAQFLQVNVERIMTADSKSLEPSKVAAGSMSYLAMQQRPWTRPDQVIAAANGVNQLALPLSPEMRQWSESDDHLDSDSDDEKAASMRSPANALRAGAHECLHEHFEAMGRRSPTSALAAIHITSPVAESRSATTRVAWPHFVKTTRASTNSVHSPLPPVGGATTRTPDSPFVDASDGEEFEF